jgi:hypothetical protein
MGCYLNGPLNLIAKIFLVRKTNRTKFNLNFDDILNLLFSLTIVIWAQQRFALGIFDGANNF